MWIVGLVHVSIAALALGHVARAAGPEVFTVPVDDSFAVDACAFPVDGHAQGAIRIHDFFDTQGNLVREISNYNLKFTYTNPASGATVTSRSVGPDILRINQDGSATLFSIGLLARIITPGEGLLAVQVGRLGLFFTDPGDVDPDLTFEAGPHDTDVDAAICQALS